ncbi:MAG: ribosome-associated translation inhibitor RaiA [Candidatus Neomarinimicrobiota bacterium]|nr:MAG: ribosome-associated translation inhibitor RaiA [Candidatus Neomarinimicrobiota bacterium]
MKISITARHFSISEETRAYVDNEIKKILKIFDRIISANIILEKIKDYEYETEIIVQAPIKTLTIHEKDEDLIKSVDLAVGKMIRQLKKYKGQFKTKHEKFNDDQ